MGDCRKQAPGAMARLRLIQADTAVAAAVAALNSAAAQWGPDGARFREFAAELGRIRSGLKVEAA